MRKINIDRIRRHAARSTPDRIQMHFDILSDTIQQDIDTKLRRFVEQMRIKHGPVTVNVFSFDEINKYPGQVVYIAEVVKDPPSQKDLDEKHEKLRLRLHERPISISREELTTNQPNLKDIVLDKMRRGERL